MILCNAEDRGLNITPCEIRQTSAGLFSWHQCPTSYGQPLPYVYLYWKLLSLSPMPWLRRKWQVGTVRPLPCCTSFLCGPLLFGPAVFSPYAHIWKNRYLFMSCFVRLKMHTRLLPCSFAVSSFY